MAKGSKSRVSDEDYWKMVDAYENHTSIISAARAGGVSESTAAKYVKHGCPAIGRLPLPEAVKKRSEAKMAMQARVVAYSWGDATEQTLRLTKALKYKLAKQLQAMTDAERFSSPGALLEAVHRIESSVLGDAIAAAKAHGNVAVIADPFAGLEDDEVIAAVEAGLAVLRAAPGVRVQAPQPEMVH